MKRKKWILLVLGVGILFFMGCEKESSTSAPTSAENSTPVITSVLQPPDPLRPPINPAQDIYQRTPTAPAYIQDNLVNHPKPSEDSMRTLVKEFGTDDSLAILNHQCTWWIAGNALLSGFDSPCWKTEDAVAISYSHKGSSWWYGACCPIAYIDVYGEVYINGDLFVTGLDWGTNDCFAGLWGSWYYDCNYTLLWEQWTNHCFKMNLPLPQYCTGPQPRCDWCPWIYTWDYN